MADTKAQEKSPGHRIEKQRLDTLRYSANGIARLHCLAIGIVQEIRQDPGVQAYMGPNEFMTITFLMPATKLAGSDNERAFPFISRHPSSDAIPRGIDLILRRTSEYFSDSFTH